MNQSTFGERVTAAISTVIAVAILGAAVTAQHASAPTVDRLASLESDLRFQLDLAYRLDGAGLRTRLAALDDAIAAWRSSARTPYQDATLGAWLEAAIAHTLPGGDGVMPAVPSFALRRPPAPVIVPRTADRGTSVDGASGVEPSPTDSPTYADDGEGLTEVASPRIIVAIEPGPPVVDGVVVESASGAAVAGADGGVADASAVALGDALPEHSIKLPLAGSSTTLPEPGAAVATSDNDADASSETLTPIPLVTAYNEAASPPPVTVDLAELNARIAGYHQSLAEIDAAIVAKDAGTPAKLEILVGKLEELGAQYQFLMLYYDALSQWERAAVTAPRSVADAVEMVARYAEEPAASDDFLADFAAGSGAAPTLAARLKAIADAAAHATIEGR